MDYEKLVARLVDMCLSKGADAAEAYLEKTDNLRIGVQDGKIDAFKQASSLDVCFRIFRKGRMAFMNCNDLRETALESAIAAAIGFAGNSTPDEGNVLPDDRNFVPVEGLLDSRLGDIPLERKTELVLKAEELAMKNPKITKSTGGSYSDELKEIHIANSNGLLKSMKSSSCSFGISVLAEKGPQRCSGSASSSRRFFADLEAPEILAEKASRDACGMLDAKMIKTRKAAVIFDPKTSFVSILWKLQDAINGERMLKGATYLGGRLDRKIASELVTIIDDGTIPGGPRSAPFDAEGVPTQKRLIIDKGVFRSFLHNTATAKKAGAKSTGNASRSTERGFQSGPGIGIGANNFFMAAGTFKPEEIIAATEAGLLVKEFIGEGLDPTTGHFSGGVSGLWIENGKIAFPVKGLTIAGTADEMFNGIDRIGNDLDLNQGGMTAPTFRITSMQIGGE